MSQKGRFYLTTKKIKTHIITFINDDVFLLFNVFVWKTERRRFEDRSSVAEKKEQRIQFFFFVFFFFFRFEEQCLRFVLR